MTKPHWFHIDDEEDRGRWQDWHGKFLVIQLAEEKYAKEAADHRLFQEKVGSHTDYDAGRRLTQGRQKPQETWHEYYDQAKNRPELELSGNEVRGWFEWTWGPPAAPPRAAT